MSEASGQANSTAAEGTQGAQAGAEQQQQQQAGAQAQDDAAKAGAAAAAAGTKSAPESYTDFKLADGVSLDPDVMGEFKALAKDAGLSQEHAQKLVDLGAKMQLKGGESVSQGLAKAKESWLAASKADKEFGGDGYDANAGAASKVFADFGTPALKELLESSGLGNHPEMIRWAYRVSKAVSPDKVVTGRQGDGKPQDARKFYPNSPGLTA